MIFKNYIKNAYLSTRVVILGLLGRIFIKSKAKYLPKEGLHFGNSTRKNRGFSINYAGI